MTVEASALRELHRLHRQRSDLQGRLDRGPRQVKAGETNIDRLEGELEKAKEKLQQSRMAGTSALRPKVLGRPRGVVLFGPVVHRDRRIDRLGGGDGFDPAGDL